MSDTMGDPVAEGGAVETGGEAVESEGLDLFAGDSTPETTDVDATTEVSESEESAPADYLFEVEGEGITLEAARDGYLRQADYTRKTQELAERRKNLQTAEAIQLAFDRDPRGTLQALANAYGVDLGELVPHTSEDMDPAERELMQLRHQVQEYERASNQNAIDRDLAALKDQYGEFDEAELINHAMRSNIPNLRAAYADLNFDRVAQQRRADEADAEAEAKRTAAKRDAQVVEGGSSRTGSAPAAPKKVSSLRDAFEAAYQQITG